MTMAVQWQDPPKREPRKVDVVAAELRARPGQWALIEKCEAMSFLPWWGSLANDTDHFEVRHVLENPSRLFGPRDIYCRYIG